MNKKLLIPLGLFIGLLVLFAVGLRLNPREIPSPLIGKTVPEFTAPVLGQSVSFSPAQLQGKVWLLNVWASWCVSCRQEHPVLMQLSKQKNIHLYGLNWKDELTAAKGWLAQHGDPYKASAFDPTGRTGIDYGVTGTPETFILDKEGIVRYKHVGPITKEVFIQIIWPVMQQLENNQLPVTKKS